MEVDEEFHLHNQYCSLLVPELDYHKPHSLPTDAISQPIPTTIRSLRTRTTWIRPDALDHWSNYQDFHHYNSELLMRQRRSRLSVVKVPIKAQHLVFARHVLLVVCWKMMFYVRIAILRNAAQNQHSNRNEKLLVDNQQQVTGILLICFTSQLSKFLLQLNNL